MLDTEPSTVVANRIIMAFHTAHELTRWQHEGETTSEDVVTALQHTLEEIKTLAYQLDVGSPTATTPADVRAYSRGITLGINAVLRGLDALDA